jgi:hypothetical protein
MPTDDQLIAEARQREADGHASELDHHRLPASERREAIIRKDVGGIEFVTKTNEDALVEDHAAAWTAWARRVFHAEIAPALIDDIGEVMGMQAAELRQAFMDQIHKLELEVAELKGELKALRAERTTKLWRPD